MTDKDTMFTLFEAVTSDECFEASCSDYTEYGSDGHTYGTCTGNSEVCPVVAAKIDLMRDDHLKDIDYE